MWWRKALSKDVITFVRTSFVGLGWVSLLVGCGFRPQFADNDTSHLADQLHHFSIASIPTRWGQVLHGMLEDHLVPRPPILYRATIALNAMSQPIGLSKDIITSRSEVTLSADYRFETVAVPQSEVRGNCTSSTYFSTSATQIFQTVSSEQDAYARATRDLARCLLERIGMYVDRHIHRPSSPIPSFPPQPASQP